MRRLVAIALSVTSMGLGAGLAACFDLFHATDDILTACELDSGTLGCDGAAEGSSGPSTDFCEWDAATANAHAEHACAWLGACEGPFGQNALGTCMFEALLAYDCNANPAHPVSGERHAGWDCLSSAQNCGQVHSCIFPGDSVTCSGNGTGTACGIGTNEHVRIDCSDGGLGHGENCALWGQTCARLGAGAAYCAGNGGEAGLSCTADSCEPSTGRIHSCVLDGGDVGIDCSNSGAGCNGFPIGDASWVACVPVPEAGAPCAPSLSVSCHDGVATSCPAGVTETIDCAALLRDPRGCTPGQLHPSFDWTSPCVVSTAPTDAGADAPAHSTDAASDAATDGATCQEGCYGTTLTGCTRGGAYVINCTNEGLGPCTMVTTDEPGRPQHPACGAP
jgi:hypothetical protein